MAPAYQSLYQVAISLDAKIIWWNVNDQSQEFQSSDLNGLITNKTKLIIVNFPHNPTGFIPSREDLNRIVEIARENNLVIFSDEMYHQLVHNIEDQIPAVCDLYENAICLWGMAKSFGLAGLRVGWLTSHRNDILQKIAGFKDYLSICNNAAGEVLSLIALNHKDRFINPNIEKIVSNKKLFSEFALRYPKLVEFNPTKAGSTSFVKLKMEMPTLDYCEDLVQKTGIMMVPSEMFEYGNSHVRIGFGRENFDEALLAWEQYIRLK